MLETESKFGLELNFKKCQLMKRKINFLDHVIENGTIKLSSEKTVAIKKFKPTKFFSRIYVSSTKFPLVNIIF